MKFRMMYVLTIAAATLLTSSVFAKAKNQGSMTVDQTIQIGSTQLKPGHYKVEWSNTTANQNQVNVDFVRHDKTVATVPAKLISRATPSPYNDIVTTHAKNDKPQQLQEIDFNHRTQALVMEPNKIMKD